MRDFIEEIRAQAGLISVCARTAEIIWDELDDRPLLHPEDLPGEVAQRAREQMFLCLELHQYGSRFWKRMSGDRRLWRTGLTDEWQVFKDYVHGLQCDVTGGEPTISWDTIRVLDRMEGAREELRGALETTDEFVFQELILLFLTKLQEVAHTVSTNDPEDDLPAAAMSRASVACIIVVNSLMDDSPEPLGLKTRRVFRNLDNAENKAWDACNHNPGQRSATGLQLVKDGREKWKGGDTAGAIDIFQRAEETFREE